MDYLRWHLRGGTGHHCGRCRNWDGQVKSEDEWDLISRPPLHYGCGCYLELAYVVEDPPPDSPPGDHWEEGSMLEIPQPGDETPVNPPECPSGVNKPDAPVAKPKSEPKTGKKKKPKPWVRQVGKPR